MRDTPPKQSSPIRSLTSLTSCHYFVPAIDFTRWNRNVQTGHGTIPAKLNTALPKLPDKQTSSGVVEHAGIEISGSSVDKR